MTRDVSEASSRRSTDHTDRPTLAVAGPIAHVVAARTGARSHRPPNVGRGRTYRPRRRSSYRCEIAQTAQRWPRWFSGRSGSPRLALVAHDSRPGRRRSSRNIAGDIGPAVLNVGLLRSSPYKCCAPTPSTPTTERRFTLVWEDNGILVRLASVSQLRVLQRQQEQIVAVLPWAR